MGFVTYGENGRTPESYKRKFNNKDLKREYNYEDLWGSIFSSKDSPLPNPLTEAHRIVVVDADAIVYRISAACEKNSVVADIRGKKLSFKTKTDLKSYCKDNDIDYKSVDFDNVLKVEHVKNALDTLKKTVAKIYRELQATHVIFLLGGEYNFRTDLKLPDKYKSNRKTTRRPDHLPACREYLNAHYDTFVVSGIEADDAVQGITEYIINKTKAFGCAYQIDKDFHTSMTPNRYWHIDKKSIVELSGGLGSLYLSGADVRGEGLHWVLFQLMQGDPSDGYTPKILYKEEFRGKYGEKSYLRDFKDYNESTELLVKWVEKWRELLPETITFTDYEGNEQNHDWLTLAEIYFQCLYMRMSPVDTLSFEKLLLRHGIRVDSSTKSVELFEVLESEKLQIKSIENNSEVEPEIIEDWEW